jgi:hypothetical protein
MSVNEIQALAQKFADAFDRRDIKTVLDMLSDDVEVFDTVPAARRSRDRGRRLELIFSFSVSWIPPQYGLLSYKKCFVLVIPTD